MAKRLALLFLFCGLAVANNCVSSNSLSTNWSVATTWNSCGATYTLGFDAASAGPYAGSGTETWSHTIGTNSNRLLVVFIYGASTDLLTGVTYGGTALTQTAKFHGASAWMYAYSMLNPPSGTASIVASSGGQMGGAAVSYYGAAQTSNPEAFSAATTVSTVTPTGTVTTLTNNDWLVGYFQTANYTASGGDVDRATMLTAFGGLGGVFDTSTVVNPAGSHTIAAQNTGGAGTADVITLAVAPFAQPSGGTIPQSADTVTIATPVVLDTNVTVTSILVQGPTANLTTNGSAHTVTTTGGVQIEQGCTTTTSPCVSPYAVDTSTGSAGNETTWVRTGMTTGEYLLESDSISPFTCPTVCAPSVNLSRSIFQAGAGGVYLGNIVDGALTVTNSEIVNGERGFLVGQLSGVAFNNVSSTGMGNTDSLLNFQSDAVLTTCLIQNVTQLNATSNQTMINGFGDLSLCPITGNAIRTDPAGVYAPYFLVPGQSATPAGSTIISYNLAKNYNDANVATGMVNYGTQSCSSSSAHHCIVENNVFDGFQEFIGDYEDWSNNVCIFLPAGGLQGCEFPYQHQFDTFTREILVAPTPTNGNLIFYLIGPPSSPTGGVTITNGTCIGTLTVTTGANSESCYAFGENAFISVNDAISNTIMYGQNQSVNETISSSDHNVFVTSGTDSVGVWNNNYSGYNAGAWVALGGMGTNVDDGTHHHPNVLYGDTTYDPKFVTTYRSWAQCDAILGGPGTEANLFTQLYNRWNGSNPANYTAQNIYNCMHAAYAPREIRLAGRGAVSPVLIFTGVQ